MRLSVLLRRFRRSGLSSIIDPFPASRQSRRPWKHVKIDDEDVERLINSNDKYASSHNTGRPSTVRMLQIIFGLLLAFLLIVSLVAYGIYKPPRFVIDYLQKRYPDVLFQVVLSTQERILALTIDDAPSTETNRILDLLKMHGAKATFFVIGNQIAGNEHILKRMLDEGHEIGNHAWADEPSMNLPLTELTRQIKKVEGLLPASTGQRKYFRPGSGFFNAKMVQSVKVLGYRTVLGSIYPHDPQIHNARINAKHVLSMARPGGVIILHDRRSYSAEQMTLVLEGLSKRNWTVVSLGTLLDAAKKP